MTEHLLENSFRRRAAATRERLYNAIWALGVRVRNLLKRLRLLGPLEIVLAYLGPRLMPPPSGEVEVTLPLAMRMVVPRGAPSVRNFMTGLYERDATRLFLTIVKEGMIALDLGANIGYYTLLASRLAGARGRVYAFEPDSDIYKYLKRNIELNGCRNVVAVERAVSDKTGPASFVPSELERGCLAASPCACRSVLVQAVALDDFFAGEGWPPVDLIKMDIEGGEKAALEGMRELSRRNPQILLLMELNLANLRRAGATPEAVATLLQELGFRTGYIIEQGMRPFFIAQGLPKTHAVHNLLLKKE